MDDRPDEGHARLILPQLRLDDLLTELQARLDTVLATRDRVHALLEAVVSIGSDLDLETVLRRIIEAATALVDARYGALGVIGEDGEHLAQFITVGVTEEEIEAIGHWPHGHGLLGLVIKEPRPLRLPDISAHPESSGFPGSHPPMRRFLGVPIRVREVVFGNLYLTEKVSGAEFDEEDEAIVTALATAAGVAIENARLYQEARRRERWLQASAEISNALLSGTAPEEVVGLVARRAREICDADLATVSLADEASQEFVVAAADGEHAEVFDGLRIPLDDAVTARVYREGASLLLEDGSQATIAANIRPAIHIGPTLIVSLGSGQSARGVLAVVNNPGRSAFNDATLRLLEPFAAQAAVALELAERRRDAERIVVLEDRERIAKDLHDTVIQRLFATAMTLMSAIKITQKTEVARRVQGAVDDLDDTIRQVRSTIFALQAEPGDHGLRSRVHAIADAAAETLGFAPSVRLDGLLDTSISPEMGEQLLAVLQEAVSNIARHAKARAVSINVDVGDELILRVEDDGIGVASGGRSSGLRNMADRAEALGGSFGTHGGAQGGTVLVWRVPAQ
jgi:signal transduction histidine kinase